MHVLYEGINAIYVAHLGTVYKVHLGGRRSRGTGGELTQGIEYVFFMPTDYRYCIFIQ
jgi:hypothetical protein